MNPSFATSSDGTCIAYTTAGAPSAPAILLIHGWSQYTGCWSPVMERLSDRFHLIAMDLRGHGASDKPEGEAAYTDTALWGDDVKAVIEAEGLERPVLVGWSYGSRVIASYLTTHGDTGIAGLVLAGGILAIGAAREEWMVGADSPGLNRDLYSNDLQRRLTATAKFVDDCTTEPLPRDIYGQMVGANMLCPAHVRRALFAADWDMRPTYAALTKPGLVIHGTEDRIVAPATGETAAATIPHGTYLPYDGIGHAPFLEAPDRFAKDLAQFTLSQREERAA